MSAILFGSISTLADTSELQRRAFNEAFEAHGLDWNWSRKAYVSMLVSSGGAHRIAAYAKGRRERVDTKAIHATKSLIFQELLATSTPVPRPGVLETVREAKSRHLKLGFVTTTQPDNLEALLHALAPDISTDTFDVIVHRETVDRPKPHGASYEFALDRLDETAVSAVAIEDNVPGVAAARAAGVTCIAFPNQNTIHGDFSGAVDKVDSLEAMHVLGFVEPMTSTRS